MRKNAAWLCVAVMGVSLSVGTLPAADKDDKSGEEGRRLQKSAEVLDEIMAAPDESVPSDLLSKAECVLVVPGMKKGAIGIGGTFGRGTVSCRKGSEQTGSWGPPAMITLGGASIGLQLGGQSTDVVMLMMNRKGMDHLLKSQFTLGGDASAAAGPKGRAAAAETDATMGAEILTYARSKGLFAGVSLKGTVVKTDEEANKRLYGKAVTAREILEEGTLSTPAAAEPFLAALTKYAPRNLSERPPKTSATKR